jgi:hypothetical protein
MDEAQAERVLNAARNLDSDLEARWRQLYQWENGGKPKHSAPRDYQAQLGLRVRELCTRHGLKDRMPRYLAPGTLHTNKWIAEQLFLKTYDLELEQAEEYRLWSYRKAAWAVDEWPDDIAELYRVRGEPGLREVPGIGRSLAEQIAKWLREISTERHIVSA